MIQLRCPRCGKRLADVEENSTLEIPCRACKLLIKYDKGTITTKSLRVKGEPLDMAGLEKAKEYLAPKL